MRNTSGTGELRRLDTPVVWKYEQIRPSWKSKSSWKNIKTQSSLEFGFQYADWIHLNNCIYTIETCGLSDNLQLLNPLNNCSLKNRKCVYICIIYKIHIVKSTINIQYRNTKDNYMFRPPNRAIIRLYMDWRRLMDQVVYGGGTRSRLYHKS
jgi:hypothetical protein